MAATLVNKNRTTVNGAAFLQNALTSVVSGNTLIALISAWEASGSAIPDAVTSSPSITWTGNSTGTTINVGSVGDNTTATIYSALAGSSATHTLTASWNGALVWGHITLTQWSGLATSSVFDVAAGNGAQDNTAPDSGTTAATAQADALAVAVFSNNSDNNGDEPSGPDLPTGYTNLELDDIPFTTNGHRSDYRVLSATGTQVADWGTITDVGNTGWSGCIAVYKAASAGGSISGASSITLSAVTAAVTGELDIKGTLSASVG